MDSAQVERSYCLGSWRRESREEQDGNPDAVRVAGWQYATDFETSRHYSTTDSWVGGDQGERMRGKSCDRTIQARP